MVQDTLNELKSAMGPITTYVDGLAQSREKTKADCEAMLHHLASVETTINAHRRSIADHLAWLSSHPAKQSAIRRFGSWLYAF